MVQLTLRNIVANKARMALITLAVAIGVSFVASTFIFSDSLSKTFDDLATDISAGVDLEVRPTNEFGTSGTLTTETLDRVRATDGVAAVGAELESTDVTAITPAGELADGFPVALAWIEPTSLTGFEIVDGVAPRDGDFVISAHSAERDGFVIGESYELSTPIGIVTQTLSGTIEFQGGEAFEDQLTFTMFELNNAFELFGVSDQRVDALLVALNETASADTVQALLGRDLGEQVEVVSSRTLEEEQAADFNSQIAILRNVLLGFAIVSLFVSTFIIYNTFGIILNQRVREIGLLRAVGADGGQIRRSVLGEAFAIGLIASALGLALGLALNTGLGALFRAIGAPLPDTGMVLGLRTVLLSFAVGVGVTFLSALGPSRQASRVAPVTAMRGSDAIEERRGLRVAIGLLLAAAGAVAGSLGLFAASGTTNVLALLGGGIAAMFLGVALLSPVLAPPIIASVGAPLSRVAGMSGTLARENAARNPRRTANTAAALMIGLALITTVLVVGQSVKAHLASTLDNAVSADFVVSNDFEPISAKVADDLAAIPEIGATLAVTEVDIAVEVGVDTQIRWAEALPIASLGSLFDLGITTGELPTDGRAAAVLTVDMAEELGLAMGDTFTASFDNGGAADFTVEAFYSDTTLIESGVLLERSVVEQQIDLNVIGWVAAGTADGVSVADATTALEALEADWPQITVQTSTAYRESIEAEIDQLLSIVNVMLALSIIIALIGIGLTLALSVFERTREIGLLRAVGMSRRQVRRMIRWEAALIASFGALLGVAMGLLYGWGTVRALPDNITTVLSIPATRLAILVAVSALAGLVAAILPARRAGRMNVLDAITGRTS